VAEAIDALQAALVRAQRCGAETVADYILSLPADERPDIKGCRAFAKQVDELCDVKEAHQAQIDRQRLSKVH
jgi:hypothetical protein